MDGTRPRDVHGAHLEQEAVGRPHPVGGHAVDHGVDEGEQAVGVEVAALSHGAGHDGGGRGGEGQLEQEGDEGQAHVLPRVVDEPAPEGEEVVVVVLPVAEAVAEGPVCNPAFDQI